MKCKPMGYLISFTIVTEFRNGPGLITGWSGTGAGEETAFSLRHASSILRRLHKRLDLRAEVIPIWGPVTSTNNVTP